MTIQGMLLIGRDATRRSEPSRKLPSHADSALFNEKRKGANNFSLGWRESVWLVDKALFPFPVLSFFRAT